MAEGAPPVSVATRNMRAKQRADAGGKRALQGGARILKKLRHLLGEGSADQPAPYIAHDTTHLLQAWPLKDDTRDMFARSCAARAKREVFLSAGRAKNCSPPRSADCC